jgi:hypothetical protein
LMMSLSGNKSLARMASIFLRPFVHSLKDK